MRPVTVSRRWIVLALLGVCIVSAGIGTGTTLLLARTGPEGPPGAAGVRGPEGPPGPRGAEGYVDADDFGVGDLEVELASLREELEWVEGDVGDLDGRTGGLESITSELCFELDAFC